MDPHTLKLLEYTGTAFSVIGQLYVAHKKTAGFWWWIAANMALLTVSSFHGLYGMTALYCFFTVMAAYSIWKWQIPTQHQKCEHCRRTQEVDKAPL